MENLQGQKNILDGMPVQKSTLTVGNSETLHVFGLWKEKIVAEGDLLNMED